jgi:hypothetical protein
MKHENGEALIERKRNPMEAHALLFFRYICNLGLTEQTYALGKERGRADELIKEDQKKSF